MKTRIVTGLLAMVSLVTVFSAGYWLGQSPVAPLRLFGPQRAPASAPGDFSIFWETWDLLHDRYFELPLDDNGLTEGAINGMMATLDSNTRYLPPAQEEAAREKLEGEFEGIGAYIEQVDGDIVVVSPIEGSPAEAAGIQPGDIVLKADGVDLSGMAASSAAELIRGPAGTSVALTLMRQGKTIEVDIVRAKVRLVSARGEVVAGDIGYVRITQFGFNTNGELEGVLQELEESNLSGLIVDLRRNPGGSLTSVVDVADQFLDDGIVVVERFGNGRERIYRSDDKGLAEELPLVVLIDEGSASASEVLAGAIQDRGRGVVIGETSFGKGTVQSLHSLSNGGGVRITVARWLTPDESWVHEVGVAPDYLVPFELEFDTPQAEDIQLQAAVDFLQGRPVSVTDEQGSTSTEN